ncbi:MAG TPA: phosphatase PAP2 family protein [Pyrinomonadaceae bacterium]|jgi:membrane-associated phospholipid phosphatase
MMKPVPLTPKPVKIARLVSLVGHPFVLLALTVLIVAAHRTHPVRALTFGGAAVLFTVSPLVFIIRRKVSAGQWSDHDVSDAAERRSFYPVAIAVNAFSAALFYFLDFPPALLAGMLISLVILLFAMLVNRWSKISLHLIFAVYFAISLFPVSYWSGAFFLLLAAAVGWSRVVLKRHTFAQVLSGAALGAIAGIVFLKIVGFF